MEILFLMIMGHFVGDFAFQNELMAKKKNRNYKEKTKGVMYMPPWWYWLPAHCFVHSWLMYMFTNNVTLAILEFFAHGLIDFGKCEKWYNLHIDQSLHILCKFVWAYLLFKGLV